MGDRSTEEENDASEPEDDGASTPDEEATGHLDDVPDGCGCVEMWEAASEYREEE